MGTAYFLASARTLVPVSVSVSTVLVNVACCYRNFLFHRARPPARAISCRLFAGNAFALASPPFFAPSADSFFAALEISDRLLIYRTLCLVGQAVVKQIPHSHVVFVHFLLTRKIFGTAFVTSLRFASRERDIRWN